ncbi:uncharacterized protein LOC126252622 [Schistocerca nitens]|uniref:uncharacterized protein LOC126252622 n=1 Tax=Schistocerca nitens TaxID=7011 RepID=UPI0021186A5F|nr:uncharacterized protein LOC126252622 [Schistocerca nitens]
MLLMAHWKHKAAACRWGEHRSAEAVWRSGVLIRSKVRSASKMRCDVLPKYLPASAVVLIVNTHSPAARYARSELVPAVWTPTTVRTKMDALERLFPLKMERFHKPPVPPHMAVAFEATRYRELAPALKDNQDAIMQLAFFSSSDAKTAKRVATNYREFVLTSGKTGNEKLVIQLDTTNKVPLLNMAALGPSYFSLSPEEGIRDCEYFFPPKEETFEEEEEGAEEGAAAEEGTTAEEGAAAAPEEGGVPAAEVPAGVEQEAAPAPAADAAPAAEPSSEAGDGPEAAAATPQEEDQKAEGEAPSA